MKLKPRKCVVLQNEVPYLRHLVSEERVTTDPEKLKAVKKWPRPTNVSVVTSFVTITVLSYYHHFIESFTTIAELLHDVTTILWSSKCEETF